MHTHTKTSSRATFPDEPGEDVCPLDFPSPFTPRPCMLLGLAQTLHSQIKSYLDKPYVSLHRPPLSYGV